MEKNNSIKKDELNNVNGGIDIDDPGCPKDEDIISNCHLICPNCKTIVGQVSSLVKGEYCSNCWTWAPNPYYEGR